MKIIICTTPIRPEPTSYPPFGSMALIQALRTVGYEPFFYDIDGLRPTFEEVVEFFGKELPDVVGISAVVSTAYAYTKMLVSAIKRVSPNTKIVVGGNLAASAEILLRFSHVDICCIGEGERVFINLLKYWEGYWESNDYEVLTRILGLTFLDGDNEVVFTGYELPIPAADFVLPDWEMLETYSDINNFITDPFSRYDFAQDSRSHQSKRVGKKLATAITAKGCVAKCTFCHRWDRGYRHWEVDRIIDNVKYLIDRYDVGFISFTDENFGSDRKKTEELIERIKSLDILYQVGGVRCRSVDPDLLGKLRDSGCVAMYYGMESGSPQILNVMEKNTSLKQNIEAARWTYESGLYTIYQMVLGMPGENHKTILETTEFIKEITQYLPDPPYKRLSINYIQALPGTATYEHARESGILGSSMEDEEQYLIDISDINAADDSKFLNFTGYDYFTVQSWRPSIVFDAEANWYQSRGWKGRDIQSSSGLVVGEVPDTEADEDYGRRGYFNLGHAVIRHPLFYRLLSAKAAKSLKILYLTALVVFRNLKSPSRRWFLSYSLQFIKGKLVKDVGFDDYRSLRKVMEERTGEPVSISEQSMMPIRRGR